MDTAVFTHNDIAAEAGVDRTLLLYYMKKGGSFKHSLHVYTRQQKDHLVACLKERRPITDKDLKHGLTENRPYSVHALAKAVNKDVSTIYRHIQKEERATKNGYVIMTPAEYRELTRRIENTRRGYPAGPPKPRKETRRKWYALETIPGENAVYQYAKFDFRNDRTKWIEDAPHGVVREAARSDDKRVRAAQRREKKKETRRKWYAVETVLGETPAHRCVKFDFRNDRAKWIADAPNGVVREAARSEDRRIQAVYREEKKTGDTIMDRITKYP